MVLGGFEDALTGLRWFWGRIQVVWVVFDGCGVVLDGSRVVLVGVSDDLSGTVWFWGCSSCF